MSILFHVPDSGYNWDNFTGDDFTGNDDDPPNSDVWSIIGDPAKVYINNNQLRTVNYQGDNNGVNSKFNISGNFDIQVDLNVSYNYDGAGIVTPFMEVQYVSDPGNRMRIYLETALDSKFVRQTYAGGVYRGANFGPSESASSTYRITRDGSSWRCYVDKGAGWVEIGIFYNIGTDDVEVLIRTERSGVNYSIQDWDNFTVVGTVVVP